MGKLADGNPQHGEGLSAVVDWLRFTCLWKCDLDHPDERTRTLFRLLRVDPAERTFPSTNRCGSLGYATTVVFDESLNVGLDVQERARVRGIADQFIVDMPGQACWLFDQRGGSFVELVTWLSGQPVRFNRIDLALDDMAGTMDRDLLVSKIYAMQFTSAFRARKRNGKIGDVRTRLRYPEEATYVDDDGSPRWETGYERPLITDTHDGYTCDFGGKGSSTHLCIYDKLLERASKGIAVGLKSWVRFEARFLEGKAESVGKEMLPEAFAKGEFGRTVAGLMRGLIEFKEGKGLERGRDQHRHLGRARIWRQYSAFLKGCEAIRVPSSQSRAEQSVTRTIDWASRCWRSSLLRLFGCGTTAMSKVMESLDSYIRERGIGWIEIARVRNWMRSQGREVTTDQILDEIQSMIDTFGGKSDIRKVFGEGLERERKRMSESTRFYSDLVLDDSLDSDDDGEMTAEEAMLSAFDLDGIDTRGG